MRNNMFYEIWFFRKNPFAQGNTLRYAEQIVTELLNYSQLCIASNIIADMQSRFVCAQNCECISVFFLLRFSFLARTSVHSACHTYTHLAQHIFYMKQACVTFTKLFYESTWLKILLSTILLVNDDNYIRDLELNCRYELFALVRFALHLRRTLSYLPQLRLAENRLSKKLFVLIYQMIRCPCYWKHLAHVRELSTDFFPQVVAVFTYKTWTPRLLCFCVLIHLNPFPFQFHECTTCRFLRTSMRLSARDIPCPECFAKCPKSNFPRGTNWPALGQPIFLAV